MPMPSLVKYFGFVGAALLALISLVNFLLEPSTGATVVAASKPAPVVRHEPGASKIERWRNEQAALKAAAQSQTAENASLAAKSAPEPLRPAVAETPVPAAAAPAPQPQTASTDFVAAEPDPDEQAEAARLKAERTKAAKAAKAARKARLARERARAEQARAPGQFYYGGQRASNQQDAYYYGQRMPQQQRQAGYAYAPRPSYGPWQPW